MTDQVNGQVTGNTGDQGGDQGGGDNNQQSQSLGWRAALSDEFKEHEYVKQFENPTAFVKDALVNKDKLSKAIFKPGKGASDEEMASYRKAMGIPDKPDDYEFPQTEGVKHDEKMVQWARGIFHQAGLDKEQAGLIAQAWDGFVKGLTEADEAAQTEAVKEAEKQLKEEWGDKYDQNLEYTKRGWKKFSNEDFDKFVDETGIGNHPALIRFIFAVGQAMGEDFSPPSTPGKGEGKPNIGMNYESMAEQS
jgi:hypothetical protein